MTNIHPEQLYDVVVIGGGPAGLTAALYLARARYRVLVVEKEHFGGQITITDEVVNYPGIEKVSGKQLADTMRSQAQSFGAEFLLAKAQNLSLEGDIKVVHTDRGDLHCFGVLLATGASPRMIGFKGEEAFKGRGVAYCATCDGEFFTGKQVFVVGGGFAAAEESVFLTKFASHVTLLVREPDFTCAQATADAARNHPDITVLYNTEVEELSGDTTLRRIRYRNTISQEITEYEAPQGDTFGVFVFAGYEPATGLIAGKSGLSEYGYALTDEHQHTQIPGLYAAGDVCVKPLRQVVTAVGDGALAATELERYAHEMQIKTGLHPKAPAAAPAAREGAAQPQAASAPTSAASDGLFTPDMLQQLQAVFERMQNKLILQLALDDSPTSNELRAYMEELVSQTDKLSLIYAPEDDSLSERPCVRILRSDGRWSGLAFHGVPGGHEFTSFVLGLYNASGPGQAMDDDTRRDIEALQGPRNIKVLVSLSCTMCPELVVAAQRLASLRPDISAEVYDLNHFPALRERYNVMSVPCLVVDDDRVDFGKKNLSQLVDFVSAT